VDSGFNQHSDITINYDPLIAKLICHAHDRESAVRKIAAALSEYLIAGVTTNIPFLISILNHKSFISGSYDINFVDNNLKELNEFITLNSCENLDEIAALLAAVMKSRSAPNKRTQTSGENRWTDLIYE
jgi:acetyl/propionyl-CoA carboxylase alpha subunit